MSEFCFNQTNIFKIVKAEAVKMPTHKYLAIRHVLIHFELKLAIRKLVLS